MFLLAQRRRYPVLARVAAPLWPLLHTEDALHQLCLAEEGSLLEGGVRIVSLLASVTWLTRSCSAHGTSACIAATA